MCLVDIEDTLDLNDTEFIRLAREVIEFGKHNCDELRVPLKNLFVDDRLIKFLAFGFPMGIQNHNTLNRHDIMNHESTRAYPSQVGEFLRKGVESGAVAGPFASKTMSCVTVNVTGEGCQHQMYHF